MSNLDDPSYFAVNASEHIDKASAYSNQDDPVALAGCAQAPALAGRRHLSELAVCLRGFLDGGEASSRRSRPTRRLD